MSLRSDLLSVVLPCLGIAVAASALVAASPLESVYLDSLWQLVPVAWLRGEPLLSVLVALHSQPPGLVALQWLDANAWPGLAVLAPLVAYGLTVFLTGVAALALAGRPAAAVLVAAAVALSPSAVLYGRFFFSTIFCAALSAAYCLACGIGARRSSRAWLLGAGLPLALASLFHSGFLPVLLLHLLLASAVPLPPQGRRAGWLTTGLAALALAIGLATPVKNQLAFGSFTPSSWTRLNLVTAWEGWSAWEGCKTRILGSPNEAGLPPGVESMLHARFKPSGHINYNHVSIIGCAAEVDLRDHLHRARAAAAMADHLFYLVANPSWDYAFLSWANIKRAWPLIRAVDPVGPVGNLELGDPQRRTPLRAYLFQTSLKTALLTLLTIGTAAAAAARVLRLIGTRDARDEQHGSGTILPGLLASSWLGYLAVCLAFNGVEMNRLRFAVFPMAALLLLHFATQAARCLPNRDHGLAGRPGEPISTADRMRVNA